MITSPIAVQAGSVVSFFSISSKFFRFSRNVFGLLAVLMAVAGMPIAHAASEVVGTQVAAGGVQSCVLTSAGGVKCWGGNANGAVGDGTIVNRSTPVDVSGLTTGVTTIATGFEFGCALTTSGGVKCWGRNNSGQLGNGTTSNQLTPVNVTGLASGVTAISATFEYACALTSSGGVKCWGINTNGQLGDGTITNRLTPVDVTGLTSGVTAIETGQYHSCALTSGGGVKCWGWNVNGAVGDGTTTNRLTPVNVTGLTSGVKAIALGWEHSCALTTAGGAKCWGRNDWGQVGDGTITNPRTTPQNVSGLTSGVSAISGFHVSTCALTTGGGVKCWGYNAEGELGDGTTTNHITAADVTGLTSGVGAIDAGFNHICALTTGGGVKCWGRNSQNQMGDGTTIQRNTAVDVKGLSLVPMLAVSYEHSCILTSAGGAKCWGDNSNGQLGDGTTATRTTPVDVSGLTSGVAAVGEGGGFHSCALTSAGGVKCWGRNAAGQLGDSTTTAQLTPVDVTGLTTGVAAIALGWQHSCALTTTGGVKCWGENIFGPVGDGTTTNRTSPVDVTGLTSGVIAIAAGAQHTCALTSGGGIKCWGDNGQGHLGDGTTTQQNTPVDVTGLTSGVAAITADHVYTCALTSAGGMKCWGYNFYGQLGDGTTTSRSTPVDVVGLTSGVTAIEAGTYHACAVTSGGGMKCWGNNGTGRLGDGTTTNRLTATDVSGLTSGVAAIGVGNQSTCALTTLGNLKCWGANNVGQLADGTTTNRSLPGSVLGLGQSISFTPAVSSIAAGGTTTASGTATSGLAVAFDSLTPSSCTVPGAGLVTATAVELCVIRAQQAGNVAYFQAPWQVRTYQVTKANQSITFGALSGKTFGDAAFTVAATASSGLAVTVTSQTTGVCTLAGNTVTIVTAGNCTIRASQAGNASYNAATDIDQSFAIAQAGQAITFDPLSDKNYGDAAFTVSATGGASGNAVTFASQTSGVCTVSGNTVTIVTAGTCTVRASQAGNTNYSAAANVDRSFTVNQLGQAITFDPLGSKTFGDAAFTVSATGGASGNPVTFTTTNASICTATGTNGSTITIVTVGSCTVRASQAGNTNYSSAAIVDQSFNIAQASQAIVFGLLLDKIFGDAPFDVSATGGLSGNPVTFSSQTTSVCSITGATVTIVTGGNCGIRANQGGNSNFLAANDVDRAFTIAPASQVINFGALAGKTFGDAPFDVSATGGGSGNPVTFASQNTDVCTTTGTNGATVTIVTGGTCTIRASQIGTISYSAAADVERSFTVATVGQSITFGTLGNKTLGDAAFDISATGGASGNPVTFASQNTSVCTTSGTNGATVTLLATSTCTIRASQTGNSSYGPATDVDQSFTVAAAPITNKNVVMSVTPNPAVTGQPVVFTFTVTGSNPTGTVTIKDGNKVIGTIDIVNGTGLFSTTNLTAGSHTLTAEYGGDGSNPAGGSDPASVAVPVGGTLNPVSLGVSPSKPVDDKDLALTVHVDGTNPTGEVVFFDGTKEIGRATVVNGKATLKGFKLRAGKHNITAAYSGDGTNSAKTSAAAAVDVQSSGGGGCTINRSAGFDWSMLLLVLMAAGLRVARRVGKPA